MIHEEYVTNNESYTSSEKAESVIITYEDLPTKNIKVENINITDNKQTNTNNENLTNPVIKDNVSISSASESFSGVDFEISLKSFSSLSLCVMVHQCGEEMTSDFEYRKHNTRCYPITQAKKDYINEWLERRVDRKYLIYRQIY